MAESGVCDQCHFSFSPSSHSHCSLMFVFKKINSVLFSHNTGPFLPSYPHGLCQCCPLKDCLSSTRLFRSGRGWKLKHQMFCWGMGSEGCTDCGQGDWASSLQHGSSPGVSLGGFVLRQKQIKAVPLYPFCVPLHSCALDFLSLWGEKVLRTPWRAELVRSIKLWGQTLQSFLWSRQVLLCKPHQRHHLTPLPEWSGSSFLPSAPVCCWHWLYSVAAMFAWRPSYC